MAETDQSISAAIAATVTQRDPASDTHRHWVSIMAVAAVNVLVASVPLFEPLFFLALSGPIGTFIRAVDDLHAF